jgi:putative heme iron utilization protein
MDRPLTAEAIALICAHMNEDHADALLSYAKSCAGISAVSATMLGMDATGLDLEVEANGEKRPVRIAFDHALLDAADAQETLIRMARSSPATS